MYFSDVDAAREATRQLSVFILIRRAAALAEMRPTLLLKLESNAALRFAVCTRWFDC